MNRKSAIHFLRWIDSLSNLYFPQKLPISTKMWWWNAVRSNNLYINVCKIITLQHWNWIDSLNRDSFWNNPNEPWSDDSRKLLNRDVPNIACSAVGTSAVCRNSGPKHDLNRNCKTRPRRDASSIFVFDLTASPAKIADRYSSSAFCFCTSAAWRMQFYSLGEWRPRPPTSTSSKS